MKTILVSILLLACIVVSGQNDSIKTEKLIKTDKPAFKNKLYTGGSLGFSGNFSDYMSLRVSPMLGAKLTPKFNAGIGLEYIYTKDKRYAYDVNSHDYGARLFGQYSIIPSIFAHAEFAGYSYDSYYLSSDNNRVFVPYILLGGGYRKQISKKSFFSVRVLFDVLQDSNSPYKAGEPQISLGFGVSL